MPHSAVASDSKYAHPSLTPDQQGEAREAAQARLEPVTRAEPNISSAVRSIVEANEGELARFATRLKTLNSLDRKVQNLMALFGDDPTDIVAGIGDLLRYTALVAETGYWARGTRIINALIRAGFRPAKLSPGWKRKGYRGRNCTFISPTGVEFEIQFHTRASMEATEQSHPYYGEARDTATPSERREELERLMDEIFDLVPEPDDVIWIDSKVR